MENVLTDVTDLEKGMESARRESFVRQNVRDEAMKVTLRDFLANAEDKLRCVVCVCVINWWGLTSAACCS